MGEATGDHLPVQGERFSSKLQTFSKASPKYLGCLEI